MEGTRRKKEKDPVKPSFMVYLKIIFLTALVIFGMVMLQMFAKKQGTPQGASESVNLHILSGQDIKQAIDQEIRTNELYDTTTRELSSKADEVLGEAVSLKDQSLEEGKNFVSDFVYDRTIVSAIEGMIDKLPSRQKDRILKQMCGE